MISTGLTHDSNAGIPEDQLVKQLLSDPLCGTDFFELGAPDSQAICKCIGRGCTKNSNFQQMSSNLGIGNV
jgi:hypothetical protein